MEIETEEEMALFLTNKRNFSKTKEPKGEKNLIPSPWPLFVVQKHYASRLHYDFRLEVGGVLKSWAVPKGIPHKPSEKRLAIETEDHPIEYATFEGVIPEGEYGAGRVEIWDRGTFENISSKDNLPVPIEQALKQGRLTFYLSGQKLRGKFSLIAFEHKENKKEWLFIKNKE